MFGAFFFYVCAYKISIFRFEGPKKKNEILLIAEGSRVIGRRLSTIPLSSLRSTQDALRLSSFTSEGRHPIAMGWSYSSSAAVRSSRIGKRSFAGESTYQVSFTWYLITFRFLGETGALFLPQPLHTVRSTQQYQ